ncbi:MAG: outer membrane beta-barrel protein, partial [Acidobacteria bacterium]|nr:outer membrane beta-barrel protein [Acidobacteriota bacterium]
MKLPKLNSTPWFRTLAAAGFVLAISLTSSAQQPVAEKKNMTEGDALPDKYELGAFGGGSFFRAVDKGMGTKLVNGGAAGFRVTENFWKHVGLEQAFTYSANNVNFLTPVRPGQPNYGFGQRIYQYSLNPVFYWTERGSKVRPFLTAGLSAFNYTPTDTAKGESRFPSAAMYGAQNLSNSLKVGLNYGGGLKWHLTDNFGLRFDVRGLSSGNPAFRLPDASSIGVYVPRKAMLNGVQTTVGLTYYIGKKAEPLPPPPPPAPKPLADLNGGAISAGTGTLCQGRAIT